MRRWFRGIVGFSLATALCGALVPAAAFGAIDELEPNDSFDTATAISMGTTVYGTYDQGGDVDYFKVTLPESGTVKWAFSNGKYSSEGAFGLEVYNKYYEYVNFNNGDMHNRVWCNKTRPVTANIKLSRGTNYLVVKRGSWTFEGMPTDQPYHFKLTYNIPGTTVNKATAKKRGFTAKWTKKSGASQYQIRYATNKSMSGAKVLAFGGGAKSATVRKLKKKKRYYVQVRVAKSIGGKTYWSSWSSKKSVKTK